MNTKKWRKLLRGLRKNFPVENNVNVRRVEMLRNCGSTQFDGTNYYIRIKANQSWPMQVDSLLHEWAHVRAIERAYKHDKLWGSIYSTIYESWEKDFSEAHPD